MVAHASPAGGGCAPCRPLPEVFRPGEVVALRVLSPEWAARARPVFVVVEVIRRERMHGSSVSYLLANASQAFECDPANVIRYEPDGPAVPLAPDFAHVPAPAPGTTGGALRWVPTGDVQAGPRWESSCGRFAVWKPAGAELNPFRARDAWTGEQLPGVAQRDSAFAWCEARVKGEPLHWHPAGACRVARSQLGSDFRVTPMAAGKWFGIDMRFHEGATAEQAHPLRWSPTFDTIEEAQRWCAIRAACVVERGEGPEGETLRYDPLPF